MKAGAGLGVHKWREVCICMGGVGWIVHGRIDP